MIDMRNDAKVTESLNWNRCYSLLKIRYGFAGLSGTDTRMAEESSGVLRIEFGATKEGDRSWPPMCCGQPPDRLRTSSHRSRCIEIEEVHGAVVSDIYSLFDQELL